MFEIMFENGTTMSGVAREVLHDEAFGHHCVANSKLTHVTSNHCAMTSWFPFALEL
jgi:hypothetical protein